MKVILVIKHCAIGDAVFIAPVMQALRSKYPASRIVFLTSTVGKALAPCIPGVNDAISFEFIFDHSLLKKIISTLQIMQQLRSIKPDMVIVGHRHSFFGMLAWFSGARYCLGFRGTKFITHPTPFHTSDYEVDRYLDILKSFGINATNNNPQMEAPYYAIESLDRQLIKNAVPFDKPYIIIFPGGGENSITTMLIKRWRPDRYKELVRNFSEHYNFPIVLIGSKQDAFLCEEILSGIKHGYNLAGKLSLQELVALGKRCRLFIGADSGPTHLIAATGAPILSIFGPSDPRLIAPRGNRQLYMWKQPQCSPCYTPETVRQKKYFNGRTFICHTGTHECMEELHVAEVWEKAVYLLEGDKQ